MKEYGIPFSSPMVNAIIDGRKTMMRKAMKYQPDSDAVPCPMEEYVENLANARGVTWKSYPTPEEKLEKAARMRNRFFAFRQKDRVGICQFPYGVGDRFWVKEDWRVGAWDIGESLICVDYKADGYCRKEWIDPDPDDHLSKDDESYFTRLAMESTDDARFAGMECDDDGNYKWEPGQSPCRWRKSITMPRVLSRIILEVTAIRAERLLDISREDALAEGVIAVEPYQHWFAAINEEGWYVHHGASPAEAFFKIWESIHGEGSCNSDPWVMVTEFKCLETGRKIWAVNQPSI
jgi:hypothetical protein